MIHGISFVNSNPLRFVKTPRRFDMIMLVWGGPWMPGTKTNTHVYSNTPLWRCGKTAAERRAVLAFHGYLVGRKAKKIGKNTDKGVSIP